MSVKRFRVNRAGHAYEAADGCLVLFEDYERLEKAVRELKVYCVPHGQMFRLCGGFDEAMTKLLAALAAQSGAAEDLSVWECPHCHQKFDFFPTFDEHHH